MPEHSSSVPPQTNLFTVRLWQEPVGDRDWELRGKVQHVLTGEVRYFRRWEVLEEFMTTQVVDEASRNK